MPLGFTTCSETLGSGFWTAITRNTILTRQPQVRTLTNRWLQMPRLWRAGDSGVVTPSLFASLTGPSKRPTPRMTPLDSVAQLIDHPQNLGGVTKGSACSSPNSFGERAAKRPCRANPAWGSREITIAVSCASRTELPVTAPHVAPLGGGPNLTLVTIWDGLRVAGNPGLVA